jgi:hypothetical protein
VLLSRLTFDFLRPVPIALLVARAEVVRAGTRVRRLQAALTTADGTPLVHASAVALRTADVLPATLGDESASPPPVEAAAPFQFSFFPDPLGYHTAMKTKIARGAWISRVSYWLFSDVDYSTSDV